MNMLRKSLHVCRAEYLSWRKDLRIYLVFVLLFAVTFTYDAPLFEYSREISYPLSPWLLPFQLMGYTSRMMTFGCAALFFANVFRSGKAGQSVLIRCGYKSVLLGKILYILSASLLYCVLYEVITLLPRIGQIYFTTGWGKFLQMWSENIALSSGKFIPGSLYLINSASGMQMSIWSFLHMWMSVATIGLLMFLLNSGGGFLRGALMVGCLMGLDKLSTAIAFRQVYFLVWISPLTWSNAYMVDFGTVAPEEGLVVLAKGYVDTASVVLNIVLIGLLCFLTYRSYRNGSKREWIHLQ